VFLAPSERQAFPLIVAAQPPSSSAGNLKEAALSGTASFRFERNSELQVNR
jgi:hypothetical protein